MVSCESIGEVDPNLEKRQLSLTDRLFGVVLDAVAATDEIRLGWWQADDNQSSGHSIYYGDHVIGTDLELYGSDDPKRYGNVLINFAKGIIIPLKDLAPHAYRHLAGAVESLGESFGLADEVEELKAILPVDPETAAT